MPDPLVLSIFPGIDLLGMAFEQEGFCIVRGPDLLWGGDIRSFHPPAGVFDGVIGGPPCQAFSPLANINLAQGRTLAKNLIPEYERVVSEAAPAWYLMENVTRAPYPTIKGYEMISFRLNTRWLGEEQNRLRQFCFGTLDRRRLYIELAALEPISFEPAVTSTSGGRRAVAVLDANGRIRGKQGHADNARLQGRSIERMLELQGLPMDYLNDTPLTLAGKKEIIGNGVPLPMGRAVAKAVKRAMYPERVMAE